MIFKVFYLFVSLFLMCSFTQPNNSYRTSSTGNYSNVIDDTTSVDNDLLHLGLVPTDYKKLTGSIYNKDYIIGFAENKVKHNEFDVYVYIYNPVFPNTSSNFIIQDFKVNNTRSELKLFSNKSVNYSNTEGLLISESKDAFNILKYKFKSYSDSTNRTYKASKLLNTSSNILNNEEFIAEFRNDNTELNKVNFNFNSFVFINDDLVQPVIVHEKTGFSTNFNNFLNSILGNNPYIMSTMFFYNFNTNRTIDKLIECDVDFVLNNKATYGSVKYPFGPVVTETMSDKSESKKYTIYAHNKSNIEIMGENKTFDAFKTGTERIIEFGSNVAFKTHKDKFEKYDYSVLIGMYKYIDSRNDKGEGYHDWYSIKDFKLTRLKFKTDGFIYNSYVADMPNDSVDPIIPDTPKSPIEKFIDSLLEWVKKHPFEAFMIALSLVVLVPVITSLLPLIIHSIVAFGGVIFKSLLLVIKLPFKLLIAFLKPPKKKDKN